MRSLSLGVNSSSTLITTCNMFCSVLNVFKEFIALKTAISASGLVDIILNIVDISSYLKRGDFPDNAGVFFQKCRVRPEKKKKKSLITSSFKGRFGAKRLYMG